MVSLRRGVFICIGLLAVNASDLASAASTEKWKASRAKAARNSSTETTSYRRSNSTSFAGDLRSPWVAGGSLNARELITGLGGFNLQNPALALRVKKAAVLGELSYLSIAATEKSDSSDSSLDFDTLSVGALAMGALTPQLVAGLALNRDQTDYKFKFDLSGDGYSFNANGEAKIISTAVSPFVAVAVTKNIGIGVALTSVSFEFKSKPTEESTDDDSTTDGSTTDSSEDESTDSKVEMSYMVTRPGLVFHTDDMEVGVRYSPPIEVEKRGTGVGIPRSLRFHGQFALEGGSSTGGSITHHHNHGLDGSMKDNVEIKLGGDTKTRSGSLGAFLLYDSVSYINKSDIYSLNMAAYGLALQLGFDLNQDTSLQTLLAYKMASAKDDPLGEDTPASKYKTSYLQAGLQLQCQF